MEKMSLLVYVVSPLPIGDRFDDSDMEDEYPDLEEEVAEGTAKEGDNKVEEPRLPNDSCFEILPDDDDSSYAWLDRKERPLEYVWMPEHQIGRGGVDAFEDDLG